MTSSLDCPDSATLDRLRGGLLAPHETQQLLDHMQHCAHCGSTLALLGDANIDEDCRRRFEAAWKSGKSPAIEAYLPLQEHGRHLDTLIELVQIDMEFQWKTFAAAPGVAAYCARFPQLGQPGIAERLALQESQLRQRFAGANNATATIAAPPVAAAEILGTIGTYQLLRLLGAGGMGVVYEAEDMHLKRRVALKVMKPELTSDDELRQRFLREAQSAAALNHDHIVTILQIGAEAGRHFLAMPLLAGHTLEQRLGEAAPLPVAEALRIGRETALGLAAAHDRGLVHRDIKPGNIWLEALDPRPLSTHDDGSPARKQRVKILDFGLVHARGSDAGLTQTGMIVGTPAYMAPEQARGEPVDGRTDLYSLGCMLYRMCAGRLPFAARDTISTLMAAAIDSPPPPRAVNPAVPAALSDLIMQLLSKQPARRPASAIEVAGRLAAIEAAPTTRRPASRWAMKLTAAVCLALAAAVGLIIVREAPPMPAAVKKPALLERLERYALDFSHPVESGLARVELPPVQRDQPLTVEMFFTPYSTAVGNEHRLLWSAGGKLALRLSGPFWNMVAVGDDKSRLAFAAAPQKAAIGKRVHLAGVCTGKEIRLFVDGRYAARRILPFKLPGGLTPCVLGGYPTRDPTWEPLDGAIDQLRISTIARYDADFMPPISCVSDNNTLAVYRFDEGKGDVVHDSSGNNRDGRIVGAKWVRHVK